MFALPSRMTLVEASALVLQVREVLDREQDGPFVVRAGALEHFDSSALALLLECRRESLRRKRLLVVKDMPAKLIALAELYGVRDLLGLNPPSV